MRIITRFTAGVATMRPLATILLLTLPLIMAAGPAGVRVQNAWSRTLPGGGTGVVCLTIIDNHPADTSVADGAKRHERIDDHGVVKVRSVGRLNTARGKAVIPTPDGHHIMLVGLQHPPVAGAVIPVTLSFAHDGWISTMASVQKLAAAMPGVDHGGIGDETAVSGMGS
jgi:periplasmic copper chaperone A